MKRALISVILGCFVLNFSACGGKDVQDKSGTTTTTSAATVITTVATTNDTTIAGVTDITGTTDTTGTTKSTKRTVTTRSRASTTATTPTTKNPHTLAYPITPSMPIEQSSQRIHNNVTPSKKIESEYVRVTTYDPEWAFMHHTAGVVYFKGKLYTAFSRGYEGEDFPGQQMVVCSSSNFYDWSEPTVIAAAKPGTYGETCIIPSGFYVAGDTLVATYYSADYDEKWFNADGSFNPHGNGTRKDSLGAVVTTDGVNWTTKRASTVHMPGGLRQMSTGRWGACAGVWFHYTDAALPNPWDKTTWNYYIMPAEMRAASEKRNGGVRLTESSWYESADGVVHLMIRSDTGYQWNAESYDGGESFTEFYPTRIATDNTQFNFWNLKDGRVLGIGSPDLHDGQVWDMWPLNLYISTDGYAFNKAYTLRDEKYTLQQSGYSKGGEYGYMKMLEHDGYLYVFYSRMKEVMEITRVKISDL